MVRLGPLQFGTAIGLCGAAAKVGAEQTGTYGPHMWSGGAMGWFVGPIMMVVMIAVIVAIVVLAVRWLGGLGAGTAPGQPDSAKTPLDILKERYARGEIDKNEFEERRSVLES